MALSLRQFETELAAAPLASPYSWPLTLAVICDVYRLAGRAPPPASLFELPGDTKEFQQQRSRRADQLGVLAHLLASTSLRDESVRALQCAAPDPAQALPAFFAAVEPLTAEMIRANAFRREELVRRWLEVVGGMVDGETPAQSQARLQQLDYRSTLSEYGRAEKAREAEAERRAKLLREAQERETAARGWRE